MTMQGFPAAAAALGLACATAFAQERVSVDRARKEGAVTLYTSMQLVDSRPLTEAFERKYGIKVNLWRASGEKVAERAVTEARGGRFDVDVIETDGAQVEIAYREKLLAPLKVPSVADVPPEILPVHGYYAPTRLTLYVMAYNTKLVAPGEVPKSYADLLQPRWAGKLALESDDVPWFASVVKAMGETQGVAYYTRLAALKPSMRKGHTLMAEMVAAGEIEIAIDSHVQGIARLKDKGAPIEWKPLQPAFGQPSCIGVAARAPHPEAARLLADFVLSREGQEIIKARNRVPASRAVDSPLNKFQYRLIDPAIALDEWDKWSRIWSGLFLGGAAVQRSD
jgi:iron(III) transport system substrate-binding protein